jgi:porphyrinogen peroxidase
MIQPRILASPSPHALFVRFGLRAAGGVAGWTALVDAVDLSRTVVGIGQPLAALLGLKIEDLPDFTAMSTPGIDWPCTQGALWLALYGEDDGELLYEARRLQKVLGEGVVVEDCIPVYQFKEGRDLSGYVDGTANPVGAAAEEAALREDGSSFVSTQCWLHDLEALDGMSSLHRDHMIGRRLADNEELADAPYSAHVERTAQEEVGFLLRRSMPWGSLGRAGLAFVAYSRDPQTFVAHGRRMLGLDDGIWDAIFQLSRPLTGLCIGVQRWERMADWS